MSTPGPCSTNPEGRDARVRLRRTGALSGLLTAALLTLPPGAAAAPAGDGTPPRPSVVAEASATAAGTPDRFSLSVGVLSFADTAAAALADNTTRAERIRAALAGLGIAAADVRTSQFQIAPRWAPRPRDPEPDWQPRIAGFEVRNQVEVDTDELDLAGALISAATEAGANEITSLRFDVADPAPLRQDAIARATRLARAEAAAAAAALGGTLGRVLSVEVDQAAGGSPPPYVRAMAMEAGDAVPVSGGRFEVRARVRLVAELQQP
jgi:uncharacterized protein YggE